MSDTTTAPVAPIVTDRQALGLLKLMELFYSDPKNREAYEQWKVRESR